ncbi:hypothetical protein E1A91_A10G204000v1 [Gossypium mustelinum]|uniref:Uncharacterized protein n=1 Tax=Gossypium mustelinum TaxID=34275 RepID=A0A5D2XP76_GOSMU|nr:hypothetical protein E1A91_A10G204000v1 [Gossypium mustelinum]
MKNQEGSPPPSSNPVQMEKNSDDTDGSRFRKENAPLSLLLLLLLFFGFVCRCTRSTKAKTDHFGAKRWQRHLGWSGLGTRQGWCARGTWGKRRSAKEAQKP